MKQEDDEHSLDFEPLGLAADRLISDIHDARALPTLVLDDRPQVKPLKDSGQWSPRAQQKALAATFRAIQRTPPRRGRE